MQIQVHTRARPHPGGGTHPPPTGIDDTRKSRSCLCHFRAVSAHAVRRLALGYDRDVAEQTTQSVEQQLEEIGTRLAWVRDYL
jgi:hypothetical protein